jgi:hypothetical protein
VTKKWPIRPNQTERDPFRQAVPGEFTTPEVIQSFGNEFGKAVRLGADIANQNKKVPKWAIFVYFALITFAAITAFSASPENQKIAIGFIFGQATLLLEKVIKN